MSLVDNALGSRKFVRNDTTSDSASGRIYLQMKAADLINDEFSRLREIIGRRCEALIFSVVEKSFFFEKGDRMSYVHRYLFLRSICNVHTECELCKSLQDNVS